LRLKKGEFKARKGDFGRVLNRIQYREALVKPCGQILFASVADGERRL
jgi:hypothetical protein